MRLRFLVPPACLVACALACGTSTPEAGWDAGGSSGSTGSSGGSSGGQGSSSGSGSNSGGSTSGSTSTSGGGTGTSGGSGGTSGGTSGSGSGRGTSGSGSGGSGTSSGTGSGGGDDASTGDDSGPGQDASVTAFDHVLFAFNGAAGGARRQTAPVTFPAGGTYSKITLTLKLDCPTGGCDRWDRFGSFGVVSLGAVVEIARFITPFAVAAPAWDYDVTDLAPLLRGNLTVQGFIDTWSPQGNPGANGAGWSLSATFTFTGGVPAKIPVAVLPVWSWPPNADPPNSAQYGDPSDPIGNHLTPQTISLPAGASSYALRTFITGHGQGNANNCAEFCQAKHTVTVGTSPFTHTPWRTCCTPDPACEGQSNPTPAPGVTPGQQGSYPFPRSGWCPGAAVDAWTQDVTQAVGSGSSAKLSYGLDSYVNACRMDAPTCDMSACVFGTGCNYDGSQHTEPFFYVSSLLIAYR